jgi:arylsulfatase A-like enzyme
MRFDNAYDETPLFCPGRATFLTGQHTRNHGVTYNDASLLNPKTTIAVAMHNAGYYTIMAGKYLNQPQTLADKTPDGWDRVSMLYDWRGNTSSRFWVQGTLKTAGFMDRFTQTQSLTDLQGAPSGQPLFMWVNPHAPHKAADPAKDWVSDVEAKYVNDPRCANIPPWKPANYNWSAQPNGFPLDQICQSLLTTDDAVGALRAEMAKQGRNPIWILTSDNGMAWGANGYPMKNVPQSTKSPLYFAGPGIPHTSTQALVSMIDLSPTIADLGGALMPWKDGLSFKSQTYEFGFNQS